MKNLLIMVFLWSCCLLSAGDPVSLADPFILLHDGTYYAYGTQSENGIVVFSSKDLKTWKFERLSIGMPQRRGLRKIERQTCRREVAPPSVVGRRS